MNLAQFVEIEALRSAKEDKNRSNTDHQNTRIAMILENAAAGFAIGFPWFCNQDRGFQDSDERRLRDRLVALLRLNARTMLRSDDLSELLSQPGALIVNLFEVQDYLTAESEPVSIIFTFIVSQSFGFTAALASHAVWSICGLASRMPGGIQKLLEDYRLGA